MICLLATSCASIEPGAEARSAVFLGAVSVTVPTTRGQVSAIETRSLGVGWDQGPFIGWHSGSWITADPDECHLLIIIRSPVEAANAIQIIDALEGQDPCIIDYTNSLRS